MNMAAMIRYETIDKCLRNRFVKYTWQKLAAACADALNEIDEKSIPSERTIRGDIARMKSGMLGYAAPIKNFRDGPWEPGYYRYTNPDFSIHKYSITKEQVQSLQECLHLIRHFNEFHFHGNAMNTIKELIQEILPGTSIKDTPIVGFDRVENASGLELIDEFYKAIRDRQVLKFEFHPFRNEPIQYMEEVHPYYLHQYNNRWFLFAHCSRQNQVDGIYKFGLERIQNLKYLKEKSYIPNTSFHPKEYFQDIIGVSYPKNKAVEKILLVFTTEKGKYVASKPIHPSQKILERTAKYCLLSLDLKINYELVREIISFMGDVEVLQPINLRKKVQEELKRTLNQYNKVVDLAPFSSFINNRSKSITLPTQQLEKLSKSIPKKLTAPKNLEPETDFERISEEFQERKRKKK